MQIDEFIGTLTENSFRTIPRNGGTYIISENGNMLIQNNGGVQVHTSSMDAFFNLQDLISIERSAFTCTFKTENTTIVWNYKHKR